MGNVTIKDIRDTFEGLNEFEFITYIGLLAIREHSLAFVMENWSMMEEVIKETIRKEGLDVLKEKIIQIYESTIIKKNEDN